MPAAAGVPARPGIWPPRRASDREGSRLTLSRSCCVMVLWNQGPGAPLKMTDRPRTRRPPSGGKGSQLRGKSSEPSVARSEKRGTGKVRVRAFYSLADRRTEVGSAPPYVCPMDPPGSAAEAANTRRKESVMPIRGVHFWIDVTRWLRSSAAGRRGRNGPGYHKAPG